ncbi:helix-turn-helix domain-containing protein [Streptomyces flaveolus]|uniref:helix-turn-helix domain-containing protein n=1 Tax=Streptomyces flaveolus TaxID=67297 RepID=UPI0036FDB501
MQHARRFLYQSRGVRLAPQTRSERHLTGSEREEISRGIVAGESARQLARRLGRSPSTVSREIARNGGRDHYRAASADAAAYERGRRPKQAKLAQRPALPLILASAPPFRAGVKAILDPEARSAGARCVSAVTVRRAAAGSRCTARPRSGVHHRRNPQQRAASREATA